jgi:hypothetical protein
MPQLPVSYVTSGALRDRIVHVFLASDLSTIGAVADTLVARRLSAGDAHIDVETEASRFLAGFATNPRPSRRMPPSGVLFAIDDGATAAYEAAPLALVHRCVRCSAVAALELSLAEEETLAEYLAEFPIFDARRKGMRAMRDLSVASGDLQRACFALLPSFMETGLAIRCESAVASSPVAQELPPDVWPVRVRLEKRPAQPEEPNKTHRSQHPHQLSSATAPRAVSRSLSLPAAPSSEATPAPAALDMFVATPRSPGRPTVSVSFLAANAFSPNDP